MSIGDFANNLVGLEEEGTDISGMSKSVRASDKWTLIM